MLKTRILLLAFFCAAHWAVARGAEAVPEPAAQAGRGDPGGALSTPEELAKRALPALGARVQDLTDQVLASQSAIRVLEDESARARSAEVKGEESEGAQREAPSTAQPPQASSLGATEKAVSELEERLKELETADGEPAEQESAQAHSQRLFREGDALFQARDFPNAAAVLRQALDVNSSDYPTALFELGESLWQQRLWASALPHFKRALSRPSRTSQQALLRAMDCAFRLGRYAEASDILSSARRSLGPEQIPPEAMYLGGKAAFRRTDVPAVTRDSEALGFFNATPPPFDLAAAYYRGAIHLRAGHIEAAVKEFQACDRFDAKDERQKAQREMCWLALGRLFSSQNLSESAYWYGQVPPESPLWTEALYEWAYTFEKDDLHQPALVPLSKIPDPDPESTLAPDVYLLRGTVLSHVRQYMDALGAYQQVRAVFEPIAKELDHLFDVDREPAHYLERLAAARGRPLEGAGQPPLSSVLQAWEKARSDVDAALDVIDDIEVAQRITVGARASAGRVQLELSRGGDMRLFPELETRYERTKALNASAFRLSAQIAAPAPGAADAPDANQVAALQLRVGAVYARTARQLTDLPNAARVRAAALRAQVAAEGEKLDRLASELSTMRSEVRELAAKLSYGAFQGMQTRLHYILLAADRGTAQVALARSANAQQRTHSLLFRRIVDKTLAVSATRRSAMTEEFERHSRVVQAEDRLRRDEAIAQLQTYVREHPDDPVFTPQALSRLGELQYLKENEDRPGSESPALAPSASRSTTPPEPRGCAATVSLYEHLATEFPQYQQNDSVFFLLGYCLGEMGRTSDAIRVYGDLVQKFPESSYVAEAEVRIGDLSFEEGRPESLRRALDAYSTLKSRPDDPFFVHALYMLGWTHYRAGDLDHALDAFTKLLDHLVASSPDGHPGGDEWTEALRQLVACFAEPKWEGMKRAGEWFERHGNRVYEAGVFFRLGDALFEQARYPAAVAAYKRFIEKAPLAPEAPRAQAKIVTAWSRENRPLEEVKERELLLATYEETGPWWRKNGSEPDLAKEVRSLREASLYSTATIHLGTAQALKKAGQAEAAAAEYQRAEQSFSRYLQSSPAASVSGDVLFSWAESAFHTGEYARAAELYERARDDAGTKSQKDAALNAVLSWNAEVARARRAGQLAPAKDRKAAGSPGNPLPTPLAGLVRASDALVERFPDHPRAPAIAYEAAEIFYQRNQVEEGRRRLEVLAQRWPTSSAAQEAASLAMEGPVSSKDWATAEITSRRLRAAVGDQSPALSAKLLDLEASARFQRALGLMEQKSWDEAAQLFTAVAADAPKAEFAAKALYNAGICRQSESRLDLAAGPYERLVSLYPTSPLAEEALFRLGRAALDLYEPEKALPRFEQFAEKYPKASRLGEALFAGAVSLEYLGRYPDAARSFTRYAAASPAARDSLEAALRAARLQERVKDWAGVLQALEPFDSRFDKSADRHFVVESRFLLAVAEEALGRSSAARKHYGQAADEFTHKRLDPLVQVAAAAAAAESRFRLAEDDLERYERVALPATSNGRRLAKALEEKLSSMKKLTAAYEAVKALRRPDWTLAASYRQGYLLESFARSILEAPVPPELKLRGQEAYLAAYETQLAQVAKPYQEQAVQVYVKTLDASRELRVKSDFTVRAAAALTGLRPREYPRQREARWLAVSDSFAPSRSGQEEAAARLGVLRDRYNAAPADRAAWNALAAALVVSGRLGEAEQLGREALQGEKRYAAPLVTLASVFRAQGRGELAEKVLEDATRIDANDASVWNGRGWVESSLGRRLQALEGFRKATELRPGFAEAQANYGRMLGESGDPAGAVVALEAAVKEAPENAAAWVNLGNAYGSAARPADALRAYERALAIDQGLADAHFDLGVLYLNGDLQGMPTAIRLQKALSSFDEFAARGGVDPALEEYRAEAHKLLGEEEKRLREQHAETTGEASNAGVIGTPGRVP